MCHHLLIGLTQLRVQPILLRDHPLDPAELQRLTDDIVSGRLLLLFQQLGHVRSLSLRPTDVSLIVLIRHQATEQRQDEPDRHSHFYCQG